MPRSLEVWLGGRYVADLVYRRLGKPARTVIKDFIETLDDAVARAAADVTGQTAGIATYIAQRVASLRSGGMAGGEAL